MARVNGTHVVTVPLINQCVGTTWKDCVLPVWYNGTGKTIKVTAARVLGQSSTSTSHYYTVSLRNDSHNVVASVAATTGLTVTAGTALTMGTGSYAYIDADEGLCVTLAQTGNGMTITGLAVEVEYEFIRMTP